MPEDEQPRRMDQATARQTPGRRRPLVIGLIALVLGLGTFLLLDRAGQDGQELSYTEFTQAVDEGRVAEVTIGAEGRVDGSFGNDEGFTTTIPTAVANDELVPRLEEQDVAVEATAPTDGTFGLLVANLLPFLLIGAVIWWFARRARQGMGGGGMMNLGQSRTEALGDAERPSVAFEDIAGYEQVKGEVREIVDFLERPEAYRSIGAKGPGGVLLVGPPGTGKTLLARAVAGEAGAPFFAAAGSEFVEMVVGVGASRVRDLFEKARAQAPSIVFIDELDSIGRKRGSGSTIGSHNEQEQTLNQILAEMDGFDASSGVVVIAATNRSEMLDDALTRPGRFDRTIDVGLPRQQERVEILEVHTRSVVTADDVDLERVARGTPGFAGADLRNLVNEAAILAVRDGRDAMTQQDLDDARSRIMLGHREDSSILRDSERHRVAVHEAGHAIAAAATDSSDPVSTVTILPAGPALGLTEQLPVEERRLATHREMEDRLVVMMGGRVAELALTGQGSSGAANDLARATQLAGRMVASFGLSDSLGPVGYTQDDSSTPPALRRKPFAEATHHEVDQEVARVLREAEATAEKLVSEHREALEELVDRLLEDDTVEGDVVHELVGSSSA